MSPAPRVAVVVAALAAAALVVPLGVVATAGLAVVVVVAVDAWVARQPPVVERTMATQLARGVATPLVLTGDAPGGRVRVRQPTVADLAVTPSESDTRLDAALLPRRRGRHTLPAAVARVRGPLGLARWDHRDERDIEVTVYPDLPAARRLALAVRQGRFRAEGRLRRGALGLGTDFEAVRDYSPDDDVRQVNWRATARLGRPMSNQYRLDQDRDVLCVVDIGRLMQAPVSNDATRLDAALDAATAVALVADAVGDRCGAMAFDDAVRRRVPPRRQGGRAVVDAVFDLEPTPVESDYGLAFHAVASGKRALVVVFTDLLDEAAARSLVEAVPVLARRHAVVVASAVDPDVVSAVETVPTTAVEKHAAVVAADLLASRARAVAALAASGVQVVEARPERLSAACVSAYLRLKSHARL